MTIKFYKSVPPYGYLNNFHKAKFYLYEKMWETVEAAYQSRKTFVPGERNKIWAAATPREARNIGQLVQLRSDWNSIKFFVMKECVFAKFYQNNDLKELLLSTGDEEIVEDTSVTNDTYWGCGKNGDGQNNLGRF